MSPMHTSKIFAVATAALLAFAGGLVLFAGSATAAEWYDYEGDVFAGHAYALAVPAGAEAIEIALVHEGEGRATFTLYDPAGDLVAHYALGEGPSKASVVDPAEGLYVLYVYEVEAGALSLRVSAEDAPELSLRKVPLAREDIVLLQHEAPEALDQIITTKLELTPVFVTLLYEGSARDLDATVSSTRGPVAVVTDETATAFSPGVWAAQSGVRTAEPANLAAGAYSVELKAEQFEGTLVLTSLALDMERVELPEEDIVLPPVVEKDPAFFGLVEQAAIAATLQPGTLLIADAEALEPRDDEEEESHKKHDRRSYVSSEVLVFAPDDTLLTVVRLDNEAPAAEIELPEAGEYVFYTTYSSGDLLAKLQASLEAPEVRELELTETTFEFALGGLLGHETATFDVAAAPVRMNVAPTGDVGVLERIEVSNDVGVVMAVDSFVTFERMQAFTYGAYLPENFAAGEHTLLVDGALASGSYEVSVLNYVREVVELPEVVEPVEDVEETEETEQDEDASDDEEEPSTEAGASRIGALDRVLRMLRL